MTGRSLGGVAATIAHAGLLTLAGARIARLVTTDKLPEYLILGRLRERAHATEVQARRDRVVKELSAAQWDASNADPDAMIDPIDPAVVDRIAADLAEHEPPVTFMGRFVEGADCPYCWPFWFQGAMIAADAVVTFAPVPKPVKIGWNVILGALAVNYVAGALSSRLD